MKIKQPIRKVWELKGKDAVSLAMTIPRELGFKPGDHVVFKVTEDGKITISKIEGV